MSSKPPSEPAIPTLSDLSNQALRRLQQVLDDPNPIPIKELRETAFGLLDHAHGHHPNAPLAAITQGAVIGALKGLASIAAHRQIEEPITVRVIEDSTENEETEEKGENESPEERLEHALLTTAKPKRAKRAKKAS